NILFICGGTFVGLDDIIAKRKGRRMIGFGNSDDPETEERQRRELLAEVTVDDVLEFGLIPELVGRLPVLSSLLPLGQDELVRIMTEPKNSLVRQYQKFFSMEKAELEFTPGALSEIARIAMKKDTGARGLRSVIESTMFEILFELPEQRGGGSYRLTDAIVRGEEQMFPEDPRDDSAAA
ncbi:MAG TPA: ATP-dependent Clp protease ATP-binding subunit ClpX, partial [Planctomycetaceae bacterium]|nr:ATP-dependent Clp protease ATP-binding subunit ClpX [Planctomycetaceae bacterium]